MQGENGGKLGMPKATDKAKKLRLPALQKQKQRDAKYAVRSAANPQTTKKGMRPNSSCAPDMQMSTYVMLCSFLKTVTRFSMK